jgi:hypothetical protein
VQGQARLHPCVCLTFSIQAALILQRKSLHLHHVFAETHVLCVLAQNKQSEFCAPLTSFDWNDVDPKRLGTSSIDTTCTIWVRLLSGAGGACTAVLTLPVYSHGILYMHCSAA